MADITLLFSTIFQGSDVFHLTRATLGRSRPKGLHQQDFYELLWVQNGQVRLHLTDKTVDLTEGDLIFLCPRHRHALQGRGEEALVVSISLHPDLITDIGQRHPILSGHLFWADSDRPAALHRDIRQLADLNQAALRLEKGGRNALDAEAFVLPICAGLLDKVATLSPLAPDWLARACAAAQDPKVFRQGAAGFVAVTGKAHAHVSRIARQHLGQSPTEFINDRRMTWAARRLTGSQDPLAEIAADCGIPNLSHFHRLFLARYQTTPHQYRKQLQHNVVQPED